MALVRNFKSAAANPNEISLNWNAPTNFNMDLSYEIIVTRTNTHFPMELFNSQFPNKSTDSTPVEVFRGNTIPGINLANISVNENTLTDTSANFPNIKGRLIRDSSSRVYRISDNTNNSIVIDEGYTITLGKYVILPDFPEENREQENFEFDMRTEVGNGFIKNLYKLQNNQLEMKRFIPGELANLVFIDGNNNRYIIKNNTSDTILLFENTTPVLGFNMRVLGAFVEGSPLPFIDKYLTTDQAINKIPSKLKDDTFYYYTAFTKEKEVNVAQADFAIYTDDLSTQDFALSASDAKVGQRLYNTWPLTARMLDESEDLEYLMEVFGYQFNEIHSLIKSYKLQDTDNVVVTALLPLSEQFGLPYIGYSLGADALRRISRNMISVWKLKGSKEGIALFIREITTWDVTGGTGDFNGAIQDSMPNVSALRFFDPNLGSANVRLTQTSPVTIPGGRFAVGIPGIVIPGFGSFREFVVSIPGVAFYVGYSENFAGSSNSTTMEDSTANFGSDDSLIGTFLLPNQTEPQDIYEIISNTSTTITVRGSITNKASEGKYAIMSPLNANRLLILDKLIPYYIPHKTKASYDFI